MRKLFFKGVIKHRKAVIVLFVLAAAVCALCKPLVGVNYDLNDYLPEGVASTEAIDVMDAQFDEGIPNMRVMVRDVDVEEALAYKDAIAAVAGVDDVMWLDDAVDIREPLEMQDADTVETYYKDSAALFSVTVAEGHEVEAVDGVRAVIGDDNAMDGAAVSTAVATTGTVAEINLVTVVAIVIILLVLVLTTQVVARARPDHGGPGRGRAHQLGHEPGVRRDLLCHQRGRRHPADRHLAGLRGVLPAPLPRVPRAPRAARAPTS